MLDNMKIANITTCDINNGPGIRITVWVSGCSHKCPECHNPELQDYDFGKHRILSSKVFDTITEELNKPYIDGITFSGGDPLCQPVRSLKELKTTISYIRKHWPEKTIWVYTGGTYEKLNKLPIINQIFSEIDVLVDGLYEKELRDITLPFRGSSNQRIIDIKRTLQNDKIIEIDDNIFKK